MNADGSVKGMMPVLCEMYNCSSTSVLGTLVPEGWGGQLLMGNVRPGGGDSRGTDIAVSIWVSVEVLCFLQEAQGLLMSLGQKLEKSAEFM